MVRVKASQSILDRKLMIEHSEQPSFLPYGFKEIGIYSEPERINLKV